MNEIYTALSISGVDVAVIRICAGGAVCAQNHGTNARTIHADGNIEMKNRYKNPGNVHIPFYQFPTPISKGSGLSTII